jgi:outer membrane protein TolC
MQMRRLRPRPLACGVLFGLAITAGSVAAQPTPAPAPPGERPKPADDPMLAPPAPAPTELASWDDARRQLATSSTDLRRADAAVARAEAVVRQARAALLPDARLSVAGSIDILHPDTAPGIPPGADYEPTSPLGTATISASQALLDLAARRGRDAARADRKGATLSRVDIERRITRDLARAMLVVAAAGRSAELNRLGLLQALERAAITQRTFQLGAATDLDVVRVEQDVAVARSAVIAGDEDLRIARESLGLLLGVDGEVGVADTLTGDQLLAGLAAECRPLKDGELRADLAAADAAIEAAERRREQARAGYYPTLDLTTSAFAFTTDPAPGRVATWTVGLSLTVPLWEGGLRDGLIAERRAAETVARLDAEDARRTARIEIARSRRGDGVSRALVDAATESRTLAGRVEALTRRSFEIGRATSLELVQSAGVLRQADLTLTLRQFDLEAARIDELLMEARCDK